MFTLVSPLLLLGTAPHVRQLLDGASQQANRLEHDGPPLTRDAFEDGADGLLREPREPVGLGSPDRREPDLEATVVLRGLYAFDETTRLPAFGWRRAAR